LVAHVEEAFVGESIEVKRRGGARQPACCGGLVSGHWFGLAHDVFV
jgi:hypothetical protein